MKYEYKDIICVLSESTIDEIFDFNLFTESKNGKESKVSKFKKSIEKFGDKYVSGLNKGSETVANALVRKPKEGASTEAWDKYNQKLMRVKSIIKVGAILASKAVLLGPLDAIATAALFSGMSKSNDQTDKMVMEKLNHLKDEVSKLKDKLSELFEKNKNKPITEADKREYDKIYLKGKNTASEIDALKSKINKPATVTESVILNKFDEYLLKEDGTLVDNAYEILDTIVEKADYTKYDIYNTINHYIDMIK